MTRKGRKCPVRYGLLLRKIHQSVKGHIRDIDVVVNIKTKNKLHFFHFSSHPSEKLESA